MEDIVGQNQETFLSLVKLAVQIAFSDSKAANWAYMVTDIGASPKMKERHFKNLPEYIRPVVRITIR